MYMLSGVKTMKNKAIQEMCKEKISEEYAQVIDELGYENALKLSKMAGGSYMYIPLAETIERPYRDWKIRQEFTGYNHKELALKYNKSEATIRVICKDLKDKFKKAK